MHTSYLTLKHIFEQDRRYIVPLYQRPYVWEEKQQWEPLWEDLRAVAERLVHAEPTRPHFMGAIVLDQIKQPTGRVESRLVIDGQQRLTTLQLLLEAASDACDAASLTRFHKAFLKLTRNDDPLSDSTDEVFKVWPTNVDRETFRRVMNATSPTLLRAEYGIQDQKNVGQAVADAYLYFSQEVDGWLHAREGETEARANAIYHAIRDNVRFVVIDLAEDDDPQLIFETLNARGTPLLPADLVKNYAFYLAQKSGLKVDEIYDRYWRPFDEDNDYWRDEVAAGRVKRTRIDLFLHHYLTLATLQEVPVTQLYGSFREFLTREGAPSARDQLASISSRSGVFRSLDNQPDDSVEAEFLERLADMEVTTLHPLLLHVFGLSLGGSTRATIVRDLESFLVRRLVCRLTTKNYNRHFLDLLKEVHALGDDTIAAGVRDFLIRGDGDSTRWPSDEELEKAWLNDPAYKTIARRRVRMVLKALEKALRTAKSEKTSIPDDLTIEHLLPQEWAPAWPLGVSDPDGSLAAERDRVLHTFGNLTLLTKSLNPAVSNGPWAAKRAEIRTHSLLRLNASLPDSWSETEIAARGRELLALARRLWPRPESAR